MGIQLCTSRGLWRKGDWGGGERGTPDLLLGAPGHVVLGGSVAEEGTLPQSLLVVCATGHSQPDSGKLHLLS